MKVRQRAVDAVFVVKMLSRGTPKHGFLPEIHVSVTVKLVLAVLVVVVGIPRTSTNANFQFCKFTAPGFPPPKCHFSSLLGAVEIPGGMSELRHSQK